MIKQEKHDTLLLLGCMAFLKGNIRLKGFTPLESPTRNPR